MGQVSGEAAVIGEMSALAAYLAQVQSVRETDVKCELTPALSARMNDAVLMEALVTGLPMVQGIQHRIIRSRGQGTVLTAKLRYRDGVRMLGGSALTTQEVSAMIAAQQIAAEAMSLGSEETCFRHLYNWLCCHVRYVHTAPGRKDYARLVCTSGALLEKKANCQGFADALYLLCGLCGISCEYRIGRGKRRLHVWNAVRLNSEWQETDVSKGARCT